MPILSATPPSFDKFVLAAHKARPEDDLIVQQEMVSAIPRNRRLGESEAKINERTWSAFKSAVEGTFTREKINWIKESSDRGIRRT